MSAGHESTSPVAVLFLPRLNKPFITFASAVRDAMQNNPSLPNPTPSLTVFAEHITAFDEAETKAAGRSKGAASIRDARKKQVKDDLFHLRDYVQSVVEANVNPATAAAVIESAFMSVRRPAKRSTPELAAKNTDVPGRVTLTAKAVSKAAVYYWEYSLDQTTWITVPETMKARTEITGLTSVCLYHFRFRVLTRAGRRDYSQVVSLLVL